MTSRKLGPGKTAVDGETYANETFEYEGSTYTIRELSVDEGDAIWDAAQEPVNPKDPNGAKRLNGRLNSRMLLSAAMVEPTVTIEQIGKWGGRKYVTIMDYFEKLNAVPVKNPTTPAGEAGQTSPSGGAEGSSPTT